MIGYPFRETAGAVKTPAVKKEEPKKEDVKVEKPAQKTQAKKK